MTPKSFFLFLFAALLSGGVFAETKQIPASATKDQYAAAAQAITNSKRTLAKQFATSYGSSKFSLKNRITKYKLSVDANKIYRNTRVKKQLRTSNKVIRNAKGLNTHGENLVQLRMASKNMVSAWQNGEDPLFAFEPGQDEKEWTAVEAYDKYGNIHFLDVNVLPDRPVFIVELDGRKTLQEGLQIMRETLSGGASNDTLQSESLAANNQSLSTSVLKHIHLKNDEEPWISGDAEIYAVTTGIKPSRNEPVLDVVDLPYLDNDGKDYYPNQILIHWNRYRWQAADILLMEQDDNTNYKELASNLLNIATQILQQIPSPDAQGYAIIPIITNGILAALPDDLFINDDDYVDTFYTILENEEYIKHRGARGNATINLSPLEIDPRGDSRF